MLLTVDAQRFMFNARYEMPVSHHFVWCDRALCVVDGSIISELYVKCVESRRRSVRCLALALQAALRPIATRGLRGANSTGRDDCTSQLENLQNAFLEGYRGIACLADCYVWLRPITIAYRCAYARHTPHVHARYTHILFKAWGGVAGYGCCVWFSVSRVPPTHTFLARGRGWPFAALRVVVIGRTAWAGNNTIRSKGGRVVFSCLGSARALVTEQVYRDQINTEWLSFGVLVVGSPLPTVASKSQWANYKDEFSSYILGFSLRNVFHGWCGSRGAMSPVFSVCGGCGKYNWLCLVTGRGTGNTRPARYISV